jgi:S1-C subfamily serine protease
VAKEVIEYLAGREEMLTVTINQNQKAVPSSKKERKASLGTIPDFAYSGRGCRISGVMPETPAEVCGLKEGDVIVRINSEHVSNLKELSDILKSLSPGNRIKITFLRNNEEMTVETEVQEK